MAFCAKCGTELGAEARFCGGCGATVGAGQAVPPRVPPPAGQYAAPPPMAPMGQGVKKGPNWWLWIGGGIAVFLLLIVVAVVGAGFFVAKKAKDAGFDSQMMAKNPVLGAARLAMAMNPEVEVVKVNEETGELTIKEKKTGKVITMKAEDIKNGKITFTDESSGETLSVGGNAGAKLPEWVPDYPGSKPQGTFAKTGGAAEAGMAQYQTADAGNEVLKFYEDELKGAGFTVNSSVAAQAGQGTITGTDEGSGRTVTVVVSGTGSQTNVMVTYTTKK